MYATGDSSPAPLSQSTAPATMSRTLAVATSFTRSYYGDMSSEPESLYRFYDDDSAVIRIDADVSKQQHSDDPVFVGQQDIHELIVGFAYNDCRVRIDSVDAVDTVHQCILVVVTGQVTFPQQANSRKPQTFTQTFLLHPMSHNADAPDETPRMYVRNDMMRYATLKAEHNETTSAIAHGMVVSTSAPHKSDHLSVQSTTPSPALSPAKTSRADENSETAAESTAKATPRREVRKESAPVSPAANSIEKPFTSLSPQPTTSPRPVPLSPSPAKSLNIIDNAVLSETASSLSASNSVAAKSTDIADDSAEPGSATIASASNSAVGPSPQRPEPRRNGPGRGGRAQSRGGNNAGSSAAVTPLSWASRVASSQPANAPAISPPPQPATANNGVARPQTTANAESTAAPTADGIISPPPDAGAVAASDADGEFHRVGGNRTRSSRGRGGAPQSSRNGERGFHGERGGGGGGGDGGRGGRGGYYGRTAANDRGERSDRGDRGGRGAQRGGGGGGSNKRSQNDNVAAPNSKPQTAPSQ